MNDETSGKEYSNTLNRYSHRLRGSFYKTASGDIKVTWYYEIYDYYDFENEPATAGIGLTDKDWHRLAVVGLAHPFDVYGTSSEMSFIIKK